MPQRRAPARHNTAVYNLETMASNVLLSRFVPLRFHPPAMRWLLPNAAAVRQWRRSASLKNAAGTSFARNEAPCSIKPWTSRFWNENTREFASLISEGDWSWVKLSLCYAARSWRREKTGLSIKHL
jgi:hypothetical protein